MSTAAKVQQDPEVQVKKLIDEVYGPDHVDDLHDEIEARKKSLFDAFGDEATEGSRAEAEAQIRFQAATLQSSPPSKPSAAGLSLNETATKPANETLKRPATKSAPNPATANPASKLAVKPAPKPVANIIQLPTLNPAQLEAAQLEFWGVRTPEQLKQRVRELGGAEPLIEGLLPSKSIGLIAGDSGLGKSPLLYQMGLSVAAGIPFLGRKTHQGRVLYMDFENGLKEQEDLMNRLALHLGIDLPELSKSGLFVSWNANDAHPLFGGANHSTSSRRRKQSSLLSIPLVKPFRARKKRIPRQISFT